MTDEAPEPRADAEQDLLVRLPLSNRALGVAKEREELDALANELADAVEAAAAGEYDGDEFGGGDCTLFFTGPDAARLFAVLQPLLRRHRLGRNAVVQLQDGTGAVIEKRLL